VEGGAHHVHALNGLFCAVEDNKGALRGLIDENGLDLKRAGIKCLLEREREKKRERGSVPRCGRRRVVRG
jgi:hypothetical protein